MAKPKLLVLGNSHTRMLVKALPQLKGKVELPFEAEIHWIKTNPDSALGTMMYEDAKALASKLSPDNVLLVSLLGTIHSVVGLIEHDIPYCVGTGNRQPPPGTQRQLIPQRVGEAWFKRQIEREVLASSLIKASKARCYHMMAPPPKPTIPPKSRPRPRYRAEEGKQYAFADPGIRLALWKIEAPIVEAHLRAAGAAALPVPAGTTDSDGFLLPEFWDVDVTHANETYGALILKMMAEYFRS